MKNLAKLQSQRASEVLSRDKLSNPLRFAETVKNEIAFVLQSFMEVDKTDLSMSMKLDQDGFYEFAIRGRTPRIFNSKEI